MSRFYFFNVDIQLFWLICWKKLFFLHLIASFLWQSSADYICVGLFLVSFLFCWSVCSFFSSDLMFWWCLVAKLCPTLCNPDGLLQAPLSMVFFRQEYQNGLPFPSPGDLPNPGIEPTSSHRRQILYCWSPLSWLL